MTKLKSKLISIRRIIHIPLSIVTVILLAGFAIGLVMAAPDDPCNGKKSERPADCGGEDTPGGEHRSLTVTFDALDIRSSNGFPYSDSEKPVYARLGGQTQPNKPGLLTLTKQARVPNIHGVGEIHHVRPSKSHLPRRQHGPRVA